MEAEQELILLCFLLCPQKSFVKIVFIYNDTITKEKGKQK